MNNEGGEADLINSFFLPGGILDSPGFDDDDEHDQYPDTACVQRQPLHRNPWAGDPQLDSTWRNKPAESALIACVTSQNERLPPPNLSTTLLDETPSHTDTLTRLNDSSTLVDVIGGDELPLRRTGNPSFPPAARIPLSHEPSHAAAAREINQAPSRGLASIPQVSGMPIGSNSSSFAQQQQPPPGFESQPSSSQQEVFTDRALKVPPTEGETDQESTRSNSSVPHDVFDEDDESLEASATSSLSTSTYGNLLDSSLGSQIAEEEPDKRRLSSNSGIGAQWESAEKMMAQCKSIREELSHGPSKGSEEPMRRDDRMVEDTLEPPFASAESPVNIPARPTGRRKRSKKSNGPKRLEHKAGGGEQEPVSQTSDTGMEGRSVVEVLLEAGKLFFEALKILVLLGFSFVPVTYRFLVSRFTEAKTVWPNLEGFVRYMLYTMLLGLAEGLSMVGLMWNCARLEAQREWATTKCFLVLYFLPAAVSLCMQGVILPHWFPHLISCSSLYLLFSPDAIQKRHRIGRARKYRSNSWFGAAILRVARYATVFMFFFDGFDEEFGMVFGMSGSGRLVLAYLLVALRQDLASSPIVWVGAAIQVLAAQYLPSPPVFVVDVWVASLGLSSVRLARFLDSEMNKSA